MKSKRAHVITILMMSLLLMLGMALPAFAATSDAADDSAAAVTEETAGGDMDAMAVSGQQTAAPGKGYTYRVTIYSGAQGTFTGDQCIWKKEFHQGESISIEPKDLGFKLKDDKYYLRGFRVTGHDNDETTGVQRLQIDNIDTDVAYEMAYGIKGALVAYTVNYEDKDGNQLHASDTYYGMPGDKPVVSYRYIDGYYPNAYNLGKTLSEDESENVFTFTYTKGTPPAATTTTPATAAAPRANAPGANAPGTAGNPAGTAAPGQDGNDTGVTIGDNDTPLAEGPSQYVDLDDNKTPLAGTSGKKSTPILIGSCIALLVGILLILLALLRRKKKRQEEEEEPTAA